MVTSPQSSHASSTENSLTRFAVSATSDNSGLGRRARSPSRPPSSRSDSDGSSRSKPNQDTDVSLHCLPGSTASERGGLEIRKPVANPLNLRQSPSVSPSSSEKSPKVPSRPSLLGLDRLAAEKRKVQEEQEQRKTVKRESEQEAKHYRNYRMDTPSNTPGITDAMREKLADRRKERDRGLQISSHKDEDRKEDRQRRDWRREDTSVRSRYDTPTTEVRTPRLHLKGKMNGHLPFNMFVIFTLSTCLFGHDQKLETGGGRGERQRVGV